MATINNENYIADYKTAKGLYTSHLYQLASYLKAKEEETGNKLAGAKVVLVNKETGEVRTYTLSRSQLVTAFKGFKALKTIHQIDRDLYKLTKQFNDGKA
jgi:hypothetical protein